MGQKNQVLVVDDERSVRVSVTELLRDAGYDVSAAADLEDAWEQMADRTFDLILTDIVMPRFSGVTLLKAIKETSLQSKVVLMTGQPSVETATEAVRAGAFDYLVKPFSKEQLLETVARALGEEEA